MAKKPFVQQRFDGGWSTDLKIGPEHGFYYSKHIDFRKSPTQLTVLPETVKESSTTVTDLITDMIQLPSGKYVAIGDNGGVYTRATNGTWTKDGTTLDDTAYGMTYNLQYDMVFIPGASTIHTITNADERFSGGSFTVNNNAIGANTDQSATTSSSTYTTTSSITETAAHKLTFTPTIEPLYSVKIWVTAKGNTDIVVTMHDSANNVLATKTLAAANITNGQLNEFVFDAPVNTKVSPNASEYHFHVTHSSGTASTIGTSTASDLSTARFSTEVARLVETENGFHPVADFLQYMCIGNGRYLSVWEPIEVDAPANTSYLRHRLVFPSGYEVTSLATHSEYLAIACEKRSSSSTNEFQDGKIFFWDGTSVTYNFFIDIPEGAPYALFSHKNILYYFANGGWWAWSGGEPVKIRQMPNTDTEFTDSESYLVNYPNTMAVRNSILLGAFPSETNSTNIEHGVYSYGSRDRNYTEGFGFSYTISTGEVTNGTLRIGMIKSFGDKLFISWRDDSTYGVDIVDSSSDPFGAAEWQSLVLDDLRPNRKKQADEMFIDFVELPTGCTVTPKYKIDRGSWVTGTAATAGDTQVRLNINKRYKEIQLGFDLVATTATPTIYGVTLIRDLMVYEKD